MTSSGKKRGAALVAGAALALGGLAAAPANAATIDTIIDPLDNTVLYSPSFPGGGSTRVDGNGQTTVRLQAGASAAFPGGTTNAIRFYAPANPALLDVTVPVVNGLATYEWNPPPGNGVVTVNAEAIGSGGVLLDATPAVSSVDTDNLNVRTAISIDGNIRDRKGYFINVADGTFGAGGFFSAFTGDDASGAAFIRSINAAGTVAGPFAAGVYTSAPDVNGLRNWEAVADVATAGITPLVDGDDDLVMQYVNAAGDSGSQVYTSYQQQIAVNSPTLTVAPGSTGNVFGDSDGPGGQPAANNYSLYDIKIVDQEGRPVAGVDVYESRPDGTILDCFADFVDPTDPNVVLASGFMRTTGSGMLRVRKQEALIDAGGVFCDDNPAAQVDRSSFVVDANGDGDYDPGTDTILKASQTSIAAAPANVTITSSLGENADDDELTTFTVKVTDADGNPIVGTNVALRLAVENRTDPAQGVALTDPGLILAPTNAAGETTIGPISPKALLGPALENDWAFLKIEITAGTIVKSLDVEFDQAVLEWDASSDSVQALNGTSVTAAGKLTLLNSGDALPNRLVGHRYFVTPDANGPAVAGATPGNSRYSATQPAGTVSGTPITATSTTAADGSFSITIEDPAAPNGEELDSKSLVEAVGLSVNEPAKVYPAPVGAQVAVSDLLDVDFLRSLAPTDIRIINDFTGTEADGLLSVADGDDDLTPGALGQGHVEARNADGVLLVNADVNLTIDEGHFVDGFEATPVVGAPVDFNDAGKTATVNTGVNGGEFIVNIERHVGFDDDGSVDDNMTATAGGASDAHDLTWTTEEGNPLNQVPGDLTVEFSADQESSILPDARSGDVEAAVDGTPTNGSGQVVDFDVRTVDQFGNRTSQAVNVTDKSNPLAQTNDTGESEFDLTQPAVQAYANPAATTAQTIEVELNGARKTVYVDNPVTSEFDASNPFAPVTQQASDIEQDGDTINWYEVDFAASSFTLGQEGPETVPVGTAVTEVVSATDQKGQPLENLKVDFLRGGPSNEDDDTCNETGGLNTCQVTDINGEAFYDFVGGSQGTANVTAVLYSAEGVRVATVGPDTVLFSGGGGQVPINAKLTGKSSQGKDILKVNAPSIAVGAKVRLQKKIGNKWVTIGKVKTLDGSGDRQFGVKDKNGKRVTKYRARVSANDSIFGDLTPVLRQR